MNKLLTIFLLLLISSSANAKLQCTPSKFVVDNYEPETFPNTNNLLRAAGAHPIICGTKIIMRGKLLDRNCVPISDAKISIWQKACDGKYPYTPLRHGINKKLINLKSASTFLGAGSTTTDNKGEFYFISTISQSNHQYVNVKVTHPLLKEFYTRISLSHIDADQPPVEFSTPTLTESGVLMNEVQIILPEKHPLREF